MWIFKIPTIPATTNKTIRFPNNLIAEVEEVIREKDCTSSAFVIEAVRIVLKNLEEEA
ncbi:MAG: YlcI/YnfO family protein [Angelakisella sp.]|nr:YlcI/YnfO family protein [Angelakisella sp.]